MNFNDLKNKALTKNQMRAIKGGWGTCGYKTSTGKIECGVYKNEALMMTINGTEGNWCCDSCATSSYCGK